MFDVAQGEMGCGTISMRLCLVEVLAKSQILVQKSQSYFRSATRNGTSLNAKILFLLPRAPELLEERGFNLRIPVRMSEPIVTRHSRLTLRLTDAAPVTPGLQPRRNRGVRCSRGVSLQCHDFLFPVRVKSS